LLEFEGDPKLVKRWVGGRAGTAVPQGAVCELPNPPLLPTLSELPDIPSFAPFGANRASMLVCPAQV